MSPRVPPARRRLGLAVALAGLLGVVCGGLQAADLRGRLVPSRLLIAPGAIAATADGILVVGSPPLSKLNVYAASGRPLRSWLVPSGGGPFRIELAGEDRLRIAPARAGTLLEYTLAGELISTRPDPEAWQRLARPDDLAFTTASGVRYTIESGRVVRSEGGRRQVLIDGFASQGELVLRIAQVGVLLVGGAAALLGGVLLTGRRRSSGGDAGAR